MKKNLARRAQKMPVWIYHASGLLAVAKNKGTTPLINFRTYHKASGDIL